MTSEFLVLKDFLLLKKGDVVSVNSSSDYIEFYVNNRMIDVPFYGNDKGRWGKDNPLPKEYRYIKPTEYIPGVHFKWVKEKVSNFCAIRITIPSVPKDLSKHLTLAYNHDTWKKICISNVIKEFKEQGVIEDIPKYTKTYYYCIEDSMGQRTGNYKKLELTPDQVTIDKYGNETTLDGKFLFDSLEQVIRACND